MKKAKSCDIIQVKKDTGGTVQWQVKSDPNALFRRCSKSFERRGKQSTAVQSTIERIKRSCTLDIDVKKAFVLAEKGSLDKNLALVSKMVLSVSRKERTKEDVRYQE